MMLWALTESIVSLVYIRGKNQNHPTLRYTAWRTYVKFYICLGEDPCDLTHNVPDKCKNRPEQQRPKPGELCER